jgi:hypothetical protein
MSSDMVSREDLVILLARAGLTLSDEQVEAARRSYANLRDLAELVRTPRDRRVESTHVFHVGGPTRPRRDV